MNEFESQNSSDGSLIRSANVMITRIIIVYARTCCTSVVVVSARVQALEIECEHRRGRRSRNSKGINQASKSRLYAPMTVART